MKKTKKPCIHGHSPPTACSVCLNKWWDRNIKKLNNKKSKTLAVGWTRKHWVYLMTRKRKKDVPRDVKDDRIKVRIVEDK